MLAIDPGTVRLGLALSDPTGLIATPLKVMRRRSLAQDLAEIARIARAENVQGIVMGLPRRLDGSLDASAQAARAFAEAVQSSTGIVVQLWDERLTTVAAQRHLLAAKASRKVRRAPIDALAAALLLQNYLDARSRALPPPP